MIGKRVALSLLLALAVGTRVADAAPLDDAAEHYRPYMIEGIGQALNGARHLRERVAAKDLPGARKAWISARAGWERSEVFTAGFVPELDAQIDAWPNADSGFHAIEAKLFGADQIDAGGETDALVESPGQSLRQASRPAARAAGLARRHRAAGLRGRREQGRWRRIPHQRHVAGRHAQQCRRYRFRVSHDFRERAQRRPTASLPVQWTARIEQLKTIVAAPDLRHVDIPALRRASEELVVALQSRGDQARIATADAGGRVAMTIRQSWTRRCRARVSDGGPARTRLGVSGRRRSDHACRRRPNSTRMRSTSRAKCSGPKSPAASRT